MKIILTTILILFAGAVNAQGYPVTSGDMLTRTIPEGSVVELPKIKWFVLSPRQLEVALAAAKKIDVPVEVMRGGRTIHGFTRHMPDGSKEIYTAAPERVDDEVTTTLGHEVLHAVLGQYHN